MVTAIFGKFIVGFLVLLILWVMLNSAQRD